MKDFVVVVSKAYNRFKLDLLHHIVHFNIIIFFFHAVLRYLQTVPAIHEFSAPSLLASHSPRSGPLCRHRSGGLSPCPGLLVISKYRQHQTGVGDEC